MNSLFASKHREGYWIRRCNKLLPIHNILVFFFIVWLPVGNYNRQQTNRRRSVHTGKKHDNAMRTLCLVWWHRYDDICSRCLVILFRGANHYQNKCMRFKNLSYFSKIYEHFHQDLLRFLLTNSEFFKVFFGFNESLLEHSYQIALIYQHGQKFDEKPLYIWRFMRFIKIYWFIRKCTRFIKWFVPSWIMSCQPVGS